MRLGGIQSAWDSCTVVTGLGWAHASKRHWVPAPQTGIQLFAPPDPSSKGRARDQAYRTAMMI